MKNIRMSHWLWLLHSALQILKELVELVLGEWYSLHRTVKMAVLFVSSEFGKKY